MEKLPGDYIAGLVDGEGYFFFGSAIEYKKDRGVGYGRWIHRFIINLVGDRELLEQIQFTLGCGRISRIKGDNTRRDQDSFVIESFQDLTDIIVPFFEHYQLRGKKRHAFRVWSQCLSLLESVKSRRASMRTRASQWTEEERSLMLDLLIDMKMCNKTGVPAHLKNERLIEAAGRREKVRARKSSTSGVRSSLNRSGSLNSLLGDNKQIRP